MSNPDWFLATDRQAAMAAFEKLLASGGCLALCGMPDAGHHAFVRRLRAEVEGGGRPAISSSSVETSAVVKRSLLDFWKQASAPVPKDVIPRWRIPGTALPLHEVVDGVATALRSSKPDAVLFLELPDRFDRLQKPEMTAIVDLSNQSGCPLVVTSLASVSAWSSLTGCEAVRLTDFTREDITEVMLTQPRVHGRRLEEVTAERDGIMNGKAKIPPEEAYVLLKAWGEHGS